MSIIDTFDPTRRAVLEPTDIFQPIPGFPETAVVVFRKQMIDALAQYDPQVCHTLSASAQILIYTVSFGGKRMALYQTLIGGAGTAVLMEKVLALGAKKVVIFGSCGTLDRSISAGHFILPTMAYRDEGVSYHYCPPSDYIEVKTVEKLAGIFDALGLPYLKGKTWTTDGFFRETPGNTAKRKADGCVGVEMECASVMAVGEFRGVEVYQFLYGEDTLDGEKWDRRTLGNVSDNVYETYLKIGLEVAARV